MSPEYVEDLDSNSQYQRCPLGTSGT